MGGFVYQSDSVWDFKIAASSFVGLAMTFSVIVFGGLGSRKQKDGRGAKVRNKALRVINMINIILKNLFLYHFQYFKS